MSNLIAYITDKSTTINMPSLENSKYSIYRDGIVLVNRQITTIFHVNRIHSYVGVLEINTASMTTRVGYVQSSTNVKTAWFQSYNRNKPYSSAVIFLTPYTPYVRRAMDEQAVDTVPPTPTILQFDMKSMETRENDEMLSLFTSTYTSGVIINSATLVVDKTTTAISSIYEVGSGVGGAIGQAGVWVYDSTVAVVSAVWDLTKMSIYLVCVVLGVYLISKVGPGLKEVTQSSTKKRKLN
jgi:hypothetical protein